jgi:hypothetical protein
MDPLVLAAERRHLSDDELVEKEPSRCTNKEPDYDPIVQTISCGHLFHKHCLGNWIVGQARTSQWTGDTQDTQDDYDFLDPASNPAQGSTCPLCRTALLQRHIKVT